MKVNDIKPCKKCGIIEIPTSYDTSPLSILLQYLLRIASKFEIKKMINWHQSLPSYIGMHSWQIKCVAFSVTVSLADAEVESVPELDIQQAAPPCFSSKHTTHCPESRSCLKHEVSGGSSFGRTFWGVACCVSRIVLATRYILICLQSIKKMTHQ